MPATLATKCPPAGLIRYGSSRATPYLYSPAQIEALVTAARQLPSPLHALVYPVLIGLLAVTGMRVGEALVLQIADLDAPMISAFLDHLETERGNSDRTRNARLAAIRSLFSYAALRHPEDAAFIQRVLAIPTKRFERAIVTYLTDPEIDALLDAPDQATWTGRRDHALLTLAIQTGLRATELTTLTLQDTHLGTGAHVNCIGKGRKQRITPLTKGTVTTLKNWIKDRGGLPADPLFPTRSGTAITRDALERRVTKHAATAAQACTTLAEKKISPHVLRHTAAMRLLNAGVDTTVIALWLGHESVATTQIYVHADLALKERALARTVKPRV